MLGHTQAHTQGPRGAVCNEQLFVVIASMLHRFLGAILCLIKACSSDVAIREVLQHPVLQQDNARGGRRNKIPGSVGSFPLVHCGSCPLVHCGIRSGRKTAGFRTMRKR